MFSSFCHRNEGADGNGSVSSKELPECQWACSLMVNMSHDSASRDFLKYRRITIGMVMPVVAVCGVIFNFLSIFVFSRRTMRCSLNGYLSALAASDALLATTSIGLYSMLIFECDLPAISEVHSRLTPVVYPLSTIAQTASVYITVCAAVDCFVATCKPRYKKRVCTVGTAKKTIIVVAAISAVYNFPRFFEVCQIYCFVPEWNRTISRLSMSSLRTDGVYQDIYYTYLYTLVMAVGPLVALIILNTFIIVGGQQQKRRRPPQTTNGGAVDSGGGGGDNITLVLVVCLFIFCNALGLIANLIEVLLPALAEEWAFSYIINFSNLLVVCNASGNFLIYVGFSAQFRQVLKQHCCPCFGTFHAENRGQQHQPWPEQFPLLENNSAVSPNLPVGTTMGVIQMIDDANEKSDNKWGLNNGYRSRLQQRGQGDGSEKEMEVKNRHPVDSDERCQSAIYTWL